MADDDENNISAEMEKHIFDMQDIDKMTNFVDNQVATNIKINNNRTKIKKEPTPLKKEKPKEIESIQKFNENFKKDITKNIKNEVDSDMEEENIRDEVDVFTDKNVLVQRYYIIQQKLKEKDDQIDLLREQVSNYKRKGNEILDSIKNSKSADAKDKKLIELVKKNQDLNLKVEKHKLAEQNLSKRLAEAENQVLNMQKEMDNLVKSKQIPVDQAELSSVKKSLKQSENHLTEIRNKLQLAKEENSKLNLLIKREVGENFDLNKALTEKNYFKPRGEIIEGLRIKVKQLEKKLNVASEIDNSSKPNQSISSNITNPLTTNLVAYSDYKREKDGLKSEIDKLKGSNTKLTETNSKNKVRISVLEKELKMQKEEYTKNMKIMMEKSDNDEKLIKALQNEVVKRGGNLGNNFEDPTFFLKQENNKLRMEIKEKDKYINNITAMLIPDNNGTGTATINSQSIDQQTFAKILTRMKELEKENKALKESSEDANISDSLAKENAKLRLKISELEERLCRGSN